MCIVNDPRPQNPYNKLYTVEYLGNMTNGKPVIYVNKPIKELKELAVKTIVDEGTVSKNHLCIETFSVCFVQLSTLSSNTILY